MEEDGLTTVESDASVTHEDRGSRFIGHVAPVASVDEAESVIDELAQANPDATHVVPAYRVREDGLLHAYSSDDGEPSGSAGKPVLSVLERRDLENCVAVVIRHYGGTNLGVGGLVRAYAGVVGKAVEAAGVVERPPMARVTVEVSYDDTGTVEAILESEDVGYEGDYGETVRYQFGISCDALEALEDRIRSATSGRATITK